MAVDVRTEPTVQPEGASDHIAAAEAAGDLIRVLDHGFVRFTGAMADDLSVVNAARASSRATPCSTSRSYVAYAASYTACSSSRVVSASSASTGSNEYDPGLPTCVRTSSGAGT